MTISRTSPNFVWWKRVRSSHVAWAISAAIAIIVLAVNLPTIGYQWLMFDDDINVLVNPYLGRGSGETLQWAFQNVDYMRRYLPLGWLGFAGLLACDGYNPAVFHAANWILTGLNSALMFFVLARLCRTSADSPAPQKISFSPALIAAAAMGSLLWSLHPLRVENAAWISGFLYVGSTTLALLSVLLYLRCTPDGKSSATRIAAAALYLGCLLIYPVFLALPAVLVWRKAISSQGSFWTTAWRETRHTAMWWASALFVSGMNTFAYATASAAYKEPAGDVSLSLWQMLGGSFRAVLHYATRTLWPGDVGVYYGPIDQWLASQGRLIAAGAIVAVCVALLLDRRTRRATIGWGGAALLTLAPFLAQMNRLFHPSDRYAVLWLAVCAAALTTAMCRPLTASRTRWKYAALILVLVGCVVGYRRALPNWKDTAALQASIDRHTNTDPNPQLSFARAALALWFLGDRAGAELRLDDGEKRFPSHPAIARTRSEIADLTGRWRERVGAQENVSPLAVMHVDLGRAWQARNQPQAAAAHFARALQLAPDYGEAARGLRQNMGQR